MEIYKSLQRYTRVFIQGITDNWIFLCMHVALHVYYATSVHRGMLWILGEYCTSVEEIMRVIVEIRTALGEVSMVS